MERAGNLMLLCLICWHPVGMLLITGFGTGGVASLDRRLQALIPMGYFVREQVLLHNHGLNKPALML
jgi:hypothetical protein